MTAPPQIATVPEPQRHAASSWRIRLVAALSLVPFLAAQCIIAGLLRVAASPVSEDVPPAAIRLLTIGVQALVTSELFTAGTSVLLFWLEARHERGAHRPVSVPWGLGLVPLVGLGVRAAILRRRHQRGHRPLIASLALVGVGSLVLLIELVLAVVTALQHSVPLS